MRCICGFDVGGQGGEQRFEGFNVEDCGGGQLRNLHVGGAEGGGEGCGHGG